MELNTLTHQAIALAGITQAAVLVRQLATTGKADRDALEASIASILKVDSDTVEGIYNGLGGVKLGLEQLHRQLTAHQITDPEQARYAASLVFLEKQLTNHPDMIQTIRNGIEKAAKQRDTFGLLHENVMANLGDLYHSTISTLHPRIMVNGEQAYLGRTDVVNKIRTTLLAGIRSAMLWKQCGGSRWKFLFFRKKMQLEIERLLKRL